jgi:diacylglycerol O-acyltransferase / wax synthase
MSVAGGRMTALDAAFYYLERTGQLLHIAGVYTIEGSIDFERLRTDLAARMHLIPRYTERVCPVPLNLAHPTWEPDPHFDIRHHVTRHTLRPPGDDRQLVNLVSRLFAQPLHRERPLWELHQIDGYRGDRSAIFCKVHHCMIDGVSGVQLLGVIFDPTPTPQPVPPPEAVREPRPLPTASVQLGRAVREGVRGALGRVHALADLVRHPGRAVHEVEQAVDAISEIGRIVLAGAPRTPFNGHVSTLRRVAWLTLSLNEVKAVKNRLGGTVNDVVLATISAALRGYLERRGLKPDRMELRAMLPVNVRRPDEHLALGNRVSMLVAPLPVGIFDPLERLRQVRAATAQLKERGQASRMTRMVELLELLPAPLQKPLGWLQVQAAPVNTVCTNVPGPPVSLYAQGKRLDALVPIVPLAQGVGLVFAILSYADTITIAATADPALVPDADALPGLLDGGFAELRTIAGVEREAPRAEPVRSELQRRRTVPSQVA